MNVPAEVWNVRSVETAAAAGRETRHSRVLHVNSGNLYGGVESILVTLARLGHLFPAMESHFALCHQGRLSEELASAGAPVHWLPPVRISRPWTVLRARGELRNLLASEPFDLVICHMPWATAVFGPAVNAARLRLGFWAHAAPQGGGWLERLARLAKPDFAIANSRHTAESLPKLFPGVPHEVIHPPAELSAASFSSADRNALRAQLGAEPDTVVIIQVSRMESWKGHALHLDALALLKDTSRPWMCWMVGGAQRPAELEYLNGLEEKVRRLGLSDRVRFLGQRADVPALLGAADIFCQPNATPEPFGICFIEALWAGKPVVSTAWGGALEIVDESCGRLVEPGDVAGLTAALRRLIEEDALRAQLGQRGPARAAALSDPATQMNRIHRVALGQGAA
jgi:glycosyltransferase involved in cell wall biosynthesis